MLLSLVLGAMITRPCFNIIRGKECDLAVVCLCSLLSRTKMTGAQWLVDRSVATYVRKLCERRGGGYSQVVWVARYAKEGRHLQGIIRPCAKSAAHPFGLGLRVDKCVKASHFPSVHRRVIWCRCASKMH